jgi:hypothetical protein
LAECRDDGVTSFLAVHGYREVTVLNEAGTYRDVLFHDQ